MTFSFRIVTSLRPGIKDNQGQAVCHALSVLGFDDVRSVRIGRAFDININAESLEEAETIIDDMCRKQLVNMIMETYEVKFLS